MSTSTPAESPGPVAVTGATGFLGSHIAEAVLDAGHELRAVVRTPSKAAWIADRGAQVAEADILDRPALVRALDGCSALVHNAAMASSTGDLDAMQRVNVDGVENTLRAAAEAGIRRVVLVSTVAVYQTQLFTPMAEDAPGTDPERRRFAWRDLTTDWRYSLTKTRGEHLAWDLADELDLDLTSVRPGPIYGPRDDKLTERLLTGLDRRLVVLPTAGIPLVHARDVADAIVSALSSPASVGKPYNLSGPPASPVHMVRTLRRLAGRGPIVVPIPVPAVVRFDCTAAERDLDFRARPLEEGLRDCLRWAPEGG